MSYAGLEEFSAVLTRTYASRHPTVAHDATDKGVPLLQFTISNPSDPRYAISLDAQEKHGEIICALWFGQAEITGYLRADDATAAIDEILADRIVTVIRYKNRDAYDDRHPASWQRIFQLTEDGDSDAAALDRLRARLGTRPSLLDRLRGTEIGVFELARWSGIELIER